MYKILGEKGFYIEEICLNLDLQDFMIEEISNFNFF